MAQSSRSAVRVAIVVGAWVTPCFRGPRRPVAADVSGDFGCTKACMIGPTGMIAAEIAAELTP